MSNDEFREPRLEAGMSFGKVRLLTCQFCPHMKKVPVLGPQCRLCGCFMRVKTRLPDATCPDNRWKV